MKVSWKAIRVFGITVGIPLILFAADQARQARAAAALRQKRQELADCKRCVTLVRVRGGLSFIEHLIEHHHFTAEEAYQMTEDVWARFTRPTRGVAH